jgi:hypothetical protein
MTRALALIDAATPSASNALAVSARRRFMPRSARFVAKRSRPGRALPRVRCMQSTRSSMNTNIITRLDDIGYGLYALAFFALTLLSVATSA